ncbi:hypothetical protein Taro_008851 [Colocasia esculenta]|uniref:Uncharacterized protein n=1 Tax=Colocasia esculenta TaxID=4460 RepID=A0A843TZC5_COLES|nr:hypothetical protein [Colocasia esculenta]
MDHMTPKYLGFSNTLHPNPRDEFTTFWGRVEELLGAGELWIDHKKDIFFPHSSAATCTNRPLEADQRRFEIELEQTHNMYNNPMSKQGKSGLQSKALSFLWQMQAKDLRRRRLDRPRSQADHDKNSVVI